MADLATRTSSPRPLPSQVVAEAALTAISTLDGQSGRSHPDATTKVTLPARIFLRGTQLNGFTNTVAGNLAAATDQTQPPLMPYPGQPMPNALPSLLRYVDNYLMRKAAEHNHPPGYHAACNICYKPWNAPTDPSYFANVPIAAPGQNSVTTFLPLEPCGHWVHYTCLIWHATRSQDGRDKCTACGVQLFQWEGITALTLATRTNLNTETMMSGAFLQLGGDAAKISDMAEYERECDTIEAIINAHFFVNLKKPSSNTDHSPDLVQCFYDVLNALQRMGRPQSKWLQYTTQTGCALWCALVAIKMRRYLLVGHNKIQSTEAWTRFDDLRKMLQHRILEEVHK
ncbi:hypothetical protein FB567DRAFT_611494 [Paraphoma chrysanthemicola]|uniref:Uncharacterized protein n=1 Tax=Paraphoma chrysanthemicola TaxID=798071 RepID=A0A8K0QV65_9PLEO|nr:hypothetical protein FB567DRAFT_611494 [Paraphoma chrysanthemicola]